jgi:hypothetical protein
MVTLPNIRLFRGSIWYVGRKLCDVKYVLDTYHKLQPRGAEKTAFDLSIHIPYTHKSFKKYIQRAHEVVKVSFVSIL